MAAVAPASLRSNLDPWASRSSAPYSAVPPTEPMTDIMSYQYPPPPPNGGDMDMPPSGYAPNYSVASHASSGMDPDSSLPSRERSELRRSISTPGVGPQQPSTPQQSTAPGNDPAGDRRRNKLGYHRTSVACGHCRRRKIRCVPSQNDVQGRCINCIRLKKECSFFPVDQQPPVDTRQKSGSRSSVGPKVASASSSPSMQPGIPSDMHGQQQPYPQLTMPSIQHMAPPMKPSGSDSYPSDSKSKSSNPSSCSVTVQYLQVPSSASSTRGYEYGQHGMPNWMSADTSPSSSKPSDMNATWRSYPGDSPITPAFSPYTPHAPPPSATWSASVGSEPSSRDDIAWSSYPAPPPRSMSFGAEGMAGQQQHQQQQQYPSISHISSSRGYDRKSSSVSADMYPPAIATTIPGIETVPGTTTLEHNASLSAGAVPPSSSYASWHQSYSYSKPAEGYGGWYGEAAGDQHHSSGQQQQQQQHHGHASSNVYYGR
ncbi:Halotolerance protein 9 [Chaetomidium leptoderma]|uniref:Halotolerance protein 9 n=1 Tax=Chaetomidium leptoderma TaxID=669021 RepID=A0AAN6ZYD3_9PEZI|nr:Halotolerance protein 9 [Chaetomidium leptoderma]